eukprot:1207213-Pyramimonas_sp.AAC.1
MCIRDSSDEEPNREEDDLENSANPLLSLSYSRGGTLSPGDSRNLSLRGRKLQLATSPSNGANSPDAAANLGASVRSDARLEEVRS